jgi:hypothetical protein
MVKIFRLAEVSAIDIDIDHKFNQRGSYLLKIRARNKCHTHRFE